MVTRVSLREIARGAEPSVDGSGVVFFLDGRVYRAFAGEHARLYRRLLSANDVEDLFAAGLVRCWPADLEVEGYDFTVECRRVPVVSFPTEWPLPMVGEAALTIARLGLALAQRGLVLKDAHPWNVLFDGPHAVFVDLGSVVPGNRIPGGWMREFRRDLVLPLALHALRLHAAGNAVLREHRRAGAKRAWDHRLIYPWFPPPFALLSLQRNHPVRYFAGLIKYLEGLRDAGADAEPATPGAPAAARVPDAVAGLLHSMSPTTVVDLAAGQGAYARLAARAGHAVTALGTGERALSRLYADARREGLPVLPLRMNALWPTGSHGLALEFAEAPARLRSDVSLMHGSFQRLAGMSGLSAAVIARTLDRFTERVAVVVLPEDGPTGEAGPPGAYDAERLIRAAEPYFPTVEALPSAPLRGGTLLFRRDVA